MIFLIGDLTGLIVIIFAILFGPPLLLVLIGAFTYSRNKKGAKALFIAALLYLIIGGGLCASLTM